jgi:hypothetical protein
MHSKWRGWTVLIGDDKSAGGCALCVGWGREGLDRGLYVQFGAARELSFEGLLMLNSWFCGLKLTGAD